MTTPTTQPDDRCEQIARDLISKWIIDNNYPDARYQGQLREAIKAALQAAKQQGREEGLELRILVTELCDALVGHGTAGAIDGDKVDAAHAKVFEFLVRNPIGQSHQQPKSEPSRECEEIAQSVIDAMPGTMMRVSFDLKERIAAALQSKQDRVSKLEGIRDELMVNLSHWRESQRKTRDELNALREEVRGVIEPFAEMGQYADKVRPQAPDETSAAGLPPRLTVGHCRAAKALRDKLKASQPTLPQQQTPHQ